MQITKVFPRMEFEIVRYAEASHQTWSKKIEKLWKQMKDSRLKKTTSFFLWPGTVSFWPSLIVVLFFPDTLVIKMPYSSKKKIKSNLISHSFHHHPELLTNPEQNCPKRPLSILTYVLSTLV